MRTQVAAAAALAGLAALTACGGSGTSLQGTFNESMYVGPGGACAAQEPSSNPGATWQVRVSADNVKVGSARVRWTGKASGSGTCTATWRMGVPAAKDAYQVTLVAVCDGGSAERIDSVSVQPSAAGNPVRLSDANGDNC